jgi:hypothetical protein
MKLKNILFAALIALVLVLGTIVTVAPRSQSNWGAAPDTSAPSQFTCAACSQNRNVTPNSTANWG